MLAEDVVLSVRHLSKKFLTGKGGMGAKSQDSFWALSDVSFDLHKGEILGIIGLNGAGKSTLLKILSEVIPPTSGEIEHKGSMLSILDVGTGFHPDLSGHENIFLNASILGMSEKEILEKMDQIVEFSGIRDSIHEPVKNYSSGMYLRLALSIALFVNNDILLLDEVISVGDVEFRFKGIQRIKEQAKAGKSCIIISHDMNSIIELCDNCILLEKGKLMYHKSSKEVVSDYFNHFYDAMAATHKNSMEHESCNLIIVELDKDEYRMDESITLRVKVQIKQKIDLRIVMKIRNNHSAVMTDSATFRRDYSVNILEPGVYETVCIIPPNLFNAGNYLIDLVFASETLLLIDFPMAARFSINLDNWERDKKWNLENEIIPFRPICNWETLRLK